MKDLPTPNEEEKKIKKLIKKFNKVAEAYTQIYLRQIKRAEKNFKKGYRGEAFVGLEAVLEFQMHLLWQFFLSNSTNSLKHTKTLTFHMARHTFATTVTLSNGVQIETVSKMLGHNSIKTTQHYAKVLDSKTSEDMQKLEDRLYDKAKPARNIEPARPEQIEMGRVIRCFVRTRLQNIRILSFTATIDQYCTILASVAKCDSIYKHDRSADGEHSNLYSIVEQTQALYKC